MIKEKFTRAEAERDLVEAIKNPPGVSKSFHYKMLVPAIIIGVVGGVVGCFYPTLILWVLLAIVAFLFVTVIFTSLRRRYIIKHISVDDYRVTTETVHSISEEHYVVKRGRGMTARSERVDNYTVRFESGLVWRVPGENYSWSERRRMSDVGVYESTHRGDTMLVFSKKTGGEAVIAYNTEIFDYSEKQKTARIL